MPESTVSGILSAAETLFLAKSYADISMEDIAAALGRRRVLSITTSLPKSATERFSSGYYGRSTTT